MFHFTHPGWSFSHPTADSEADCLKRFMAERDQYIRDMEAIATNSGLVPTPAKRSTWHVHAFVQYQVLNRAKQEIAYQLAAKENHAVTVSAVEKQCREIALDAGITLRKERDRWTHRPTSRSAVFERKAFKLPPLIPGPCIGITGTAQLRACFNTSA